MPVIIDGTNGVNASAVTTTSWNPTNLVIPGNSTIGDSTADNVTINAGSFNFAQTGQRIIGDFSNATAANRLSIQSSTTNGNTLLNLIPNGTSVTSTYYAWGGSDTTNAAVMMMGIGLTAGFNSFKTGTGTYLDMTFSTGGSERMRIATDGSVGIGIAPTSKLHVSSTTVSDSRQYIQFQAVGTSSTTALRLIQYSDNSTVRANEVWIDSNTASSQLVLATQNAERLRIDASGNIFMYGQGAADKGTLTLSSPDSFIRLKTTGGAANKQQWDIRAISATGSEALEIRTINDANSVFSTKMWIANGGNVGIGNIAPAEKLEVTGKVRIFDGGYPYIDLGISTSNYFRLIHDNPNDKFVIGKNGGNHLIVNGSGYVGVNTASPVTALDVTGVITQNNSGKLNKQTLTVAGNVTRYLQVLGNNSYGTVHVEVSGYGSSGSGNCLISWIDGGHWGGNSYHRVQQLARQTQGNPTLGALRKIAGGAYIAITNTSANAITLFVTTDVNASNNNDCVVSLETTEPTGGMDVSFVNVDDVYGTVILGNYSNKAPFNSGWAPAVSAYQTNGTYCSLGVFSNSTSYANTALAVQIARSATSSYDMIGCWSGATQVGGSLEDREFRVSGDGVVAGDQSYAVGADYAEYFEWVDGNSDNEDRRGFTVSLIGNKIKVAEEGDNVIGVISANPSVVGDSAWNRWTEKYLRDDFGSYIYEEYEVYQWTETITLDDEYPSKVKEEEKSCEVDNIPEGIVVPNDAKIIVQQRRKLNSDYNPDQEYIARQHRKEWDAVGLMGKLRMRKGQTTAANWIKMRDISSSVEEWLVR